MLTFRSKFLLLFTLIFFNLGLYTPLSHAQSPAQEHQAFSIAREHLYAGTHQKGINQLQTFADKDPSSPEISFAQGSLQAAFAIERFSQTLIRYGFRPNQNLNSILPPYLHTLFNKKPKETITYEKWNQALLQFRQDLELARQLLNKVGEQNVSFKLQPARIRFDIDGDGKATESESLWFITSFDSNDLKKKEGLEFQEVVFDAADAAWLRGYASLVSAKLSFLLGYNTEESFNPLRELLFGDHIFPLPQNPEELQKIPRNTVRYQGFSSSIMLAHTIDWPIADKSRIQEVRSLLKDMISMSRLSWKIIQKRDDKESLRWIPAPQQKGVLKVEVTQEMIDSWLGLLDIAEAVLDGKKLVPGAPYWLTAKDNGINIYKFFENPEPFDLIGILTGYKIQSFIEKGDVLTMSEWEKVTRAFGRNLLFYSAWFN